MKDTILKILRNILWVAGFPIIVIVLGLFMWNSYFIDFMSE